LPDARQGSDGRVNSTPFLNRVSQKLGSNGFMPMGPQFYQPAGFKYAARRSRFEISKFGMHDAVFVFAEIPDLDPAKMKNFADAAFNFANSNKSVSLPNGFFMSVSCFPVAITENLHPQMSQMIRDNAPTNHFGGFEMPVAYDVTSGMLSYYERTQLWGAAYIAGFRRVVVDNLA
jgi:hypothetical protein